MLLSGLLLGFIFSSLIVQGNTANSCHRLTGQQIDNVTECVLSSIIQKGYNEKFWGQNVTNAKAVSFICNHTVELFKECPCSREVLHFVVNTCHKKEEPLVGIRLLSSVISSISRPAGHDVLSTTEENEPLSGESVLYHSVVNPEESEAVKFWFSWKGFAVLLAIKLMMIACGVFGICVGCIVMIYCLMMMQKKEKEMEQLRESVLAQKKAIRKEKRFQERTCSQTRPQSHAESSSYPSARHSSKSSRRSSRRV
ncbi:unnamed protein product, partial [Mesorhabditis belari]|uniref:Uncharacterized protein n=1 Tax=Mesorhabditis belari TaxID=2138241 RepID=A0AAF3FMZ0_9BILA